MMVSPNNNNNDDIDLGHCQGQQQQQEENTSSSTIVRRPQTVSSLSSLETTGYDLNDIGQGLDFNFSNTNTNTNNQQSTVPSPLLPSLMESRISSNTLVTTSTTAASAGGDITEQQQHQHQQHHSQELQHHPLAVTSSIASLAVTQVQSSGMIATGSMQIISPSTGGVVMASAITNSTANANTVPEFLYQLTKMLTDNNRDIIEWSNSKIEVHSPHKLETHVLNRYFRHSKFASFQRQLNYFGFRKLAGKGKMAPCSYVNDATTDELGSLLHIKRKQGNEPPSKKGGKKRERSGKQGKPTAARNIGRCSSTIGATNDGVNPVLAGILYRSSSENAITTSNNNNVNTSSINNTLQQSQKAIARVAVGKGVRHGFVPQQLHQNNTLKNSNSSPNVLAAAAAIAASNSNNAQVSARPVAHSPVHASLNALTQNFNESLQGATDSANEIEGKPAAATAASAIPNHQVEVGYIPGSLHRDDSLVDLAMIPDIGDGQTTNEDNITSSTGFSFVDFPFDSDFFSSDDPRI